MSISSWAVIGMVIPMPFRDRGATCYEGESRQFDWGILLATGNCSILRIVGQPQTLKVSLIPGVFTWKLDNLGCHP